MPHRCVGVSVDAFLVSYPACLQLLFCAADSRYLWRAEHRMGHCRVIDRDHCLGFDDVVKRIPGFLVCGMLELVAPDHVAQCKDALDAGLEVLVYDYKSLGVCLDAALGDVQE